MPSLNDSQQNVKSEFTDTLDTAALDARIEELTRRRSEMARRAAGTGGEQGGAMANIAGAGVDSFAQAFVDRFASSNGMMGEAAAGENKGENKEAVMSGGFDPMGGMAGGAAGNNEGRDSMGGKGDMPMGMNYMNQGMMQGMPMNMGFDRRNSQMSMNSMEGQQQAFQNWQQSQQMNPYFQMQRMSMMGNGAGMGMNNMMMQNGPGGFNPMMGMYPGMMQQMQPGDAKDADPTGKQTKAKKPRKKRGTITEIEITPELVEASKGPFKTLDAGIPLALDEDKDWLTPLHCFVRRNCVEAFTACQEDVHAPSKGKRKPIQIGQVGIRCPHCHVASTPKDGDGNEATHERGSIYYPTSLASIYNATMNLLQRHINSCPKVPAAIMAKYADLKQDDARSGTSKKYWIESAKSIGFVDTLKGIRLSADAPPSLSDSLITGEDAGAKEAAKEDSGDSEKDDAKDDDAEKKGDDKAAVKKKSDSGSEFFKKKPKEHEVEAVPLVLPSDKEASTTFSYLLLSQMQPCVFTEADRLGKRKGLPTGFAGLACRHCFGGYGSGRFFPSSIKTLSDTSKTLNVLHNHMSRCRKCPKEVIEELAAAKLTHDDERAKMKFGSQKAFFAKIWARLHDNRPYDPVAVRNSQSSKSTPGDGSMPKSSQPKMLQFPPGMSQDMAFMTGQMPNMMGPQGQMPMLPSMGGAQGGMSMMGGPQQMNMGMMGMGGMMNPEMMMRGYPEQFMGGGFNNMAQIGGVNGGEMPQTSGQKRSAEDDQMESNKRVKEI